MRKAKQNALPLEEQRMDETPKESLSASTPDSKAEGDASYLALAKEVRDKVQAFVRKMDEDGGLECLINCDDYGNSVLTLHLRWADKYLHCAVRRLEAFVARLETLSDPDQPIPFELTNKEPE